jgi:hypothetical protein
VRLDGARVVGAERAFHERREGVFVGAGLVHAYSFK